MRLFVAIDLPEDVKEHLRDLQKSLRSILPEMKASYAHDFHMTLKFLGESSEGACKRMTEELEKISFESFDASLGVPGTFGGFKPKVIWISLATPLWLSRTVKEIEEKCARYGFARENRFKPHITLARIKFAEDGKKILDEVAKFKVKKLKFRVKNFYLYESMLGKKGVEHIKLREFPLN